LREREKIVDENEGSPGELDRFDVPSPLQLLRL